MLIHTRCDPLNTTPPHGDKSKTLTAATPISGLNLCTCINVLIMIRIQNGIVSQKAFVFDPFNKVTWISIQH